MRLLPSTIIAMLGLLMIGTAMAQPPVAHAPAPTAIANTQKSEMPSPIFRVCISRFDRMAAGPGLTEANALLVDAECREATDTAPQRCDAFLIGASHAGSKAVALVRSRWAEAETGEYLAAVEVAKAGREACGV